MLRAFLVTMLILLVIGGALAQNIWKGEVSVVRDHRYISPWSASNNELLYRDTNGTCTSSTWTWNSWFWPTNGWAFGFRCDSVVAKSPPDTLFIDWRYVVEAGVTEATSWAALDTIVPPYRTIPTVTVWTVVTMPTPKPEYIQARYRAKDADSCDVYVEGKWMAW